MNHLSLHILAEHLSDLLHCEQEDLCLPILHQVSRGKPLAKATLAATLQISLQELEQRLLHLKETEYDEGNNILGWGVTLAPTRHRFQVHDQSLFTWCAFDTVLFPPSLHTEALVLSTCESTGQPITFVATPKGTIRGLMPVSACLSLILPASRKECTRETFCMQSLFFASEQAALTFLREHPEAFLLSIEEAAIVGKHVASTRFSQIHAGPQKEQKG